MDKEKESRQITSKIEFRSVQDQEGNEYFEGYALKFERWSDVLFGYFKEIISRNALDKTDMSDVLATFNHKRDMPLARTTAAEDVGKLELEVDNIGLKFRFKPTATTYAADLKENTRAGIVDKCSFIFTLDYEDENCEEWIWNEDEKVYDRRLNNIKKLYDISIVTDPAYSDTEAVLGQRSKDKVEEFRKKPEIEKLKLELDLIEI